jgi:hypothetical protein
LSQIVDLQHKLKEVGLLKQLEFANHWPSTTYSAEC